jgi:hypothetical protein
MNTKKDPAITRKEEDEEEDEDAALGLGFSPPAKPSQAQVAAALLRLVEIGDHREKKTQPQNRRKCESRERSGPPAVFVVLTSAEFRAGGGAGSGDRCCAVTQPGFRSFNHFVMSSQSGDHPENHLA